MKKKKFEKNMRVSAISSIRLKIYANQFYSLRTYIG